MLAASNWHLSHKISKIMSSSKNTSYIFVRSRTIPSFFDDVSSGIYKLTVEVEGPVTVAAPADAAFRAENCHLQTL